MRLLLINPKFPESFWSFKWAVDRILPHKRTVNPPLGLTTLAALSPEDWQIEIVDENIESIPLNPQSDIIGICGMGVQYKRQKELLNFYRKNGFYTVAGGSYASLCPEAYYENADTVVAGEAEYIWKEFCRDFEKGKPKKAYQETGEVDLIDSPVPRFDLLKLHKYKSLSLQFSRGCPYFCDFCDIIVMFGRKPRTKSLAQVGKELDFLRKLDAHNVFFVDDNLIGNKPVAKGLMRFLCDYQQKHNYSFHFGTEVSLNLAYDEELLNLFRAANFGWVFIGIESPDKASLKETRKFQNMREDMLTSIRKIYAHGIEIMAGFIIGFDNDTTKTFGLQYRFIMESGIHAAMIGLLMAVPKTPLYQRLKKEGRIRQNVESCDNTKLGTNFIPKQMTYDEMVTGYRNLYFKLLENRNIAHRIKNKLQFIKNPVFINTFSFKELCQISVKFLYRGIISGGWSRIYHFSRTISITKPWKIPMAVQDWIIALSMRDYVDRHFQFVKADERVENLLKEYLLQIEQVFQRYLRSGSLEISLQSAKSTASNLLISLKGRLDKPFFKQALHHLDHVLKDSTTSVTLRIDDIHQSHLKYLNRMLSGLSRYGDRIYIKIHETLLERIEIDSSLFNLVLEK